jgi:hypothetical protein
MRKLQKRLMIGSLLTAILGIGFYAWALNPTLGNLRINNFTASRPLGSGKDTYTVVVQNGGSDSAYHVRVAFRVPDDLGGQNITLPSPGVTTSLTGPGGGGLPPVCNGTSTLTYGSSGLRIVVCTTERLDPSGTWTITIPINNSGAINRIASVQVFADTPDGNSVGSNSMLDNFKALNGVF